MISLKILVRNWLVKYQKCLTYINELNVIMESKPLSINDLNDRFFLLKINKSLGVNNVSHSII